MAKNEPDTYYHVHRSEHGLCGYCGVEDPERCTFVYCPGCPPNCQVKNPPKYERCPKCGVNFLYPLSRNHSEEECVG